MFFLIGLAMIVVAIILMAIFRAVLRSAKQESALRVLVTSEFAALVVTTLISCGALIAIEGIIDAKGVLRTAELGGGLVAIVAVWLVAWRFSAPRISAR